ncbi:hypothetical protein CEE36_08150 [candidate division TA06 bacterium B3_TA06]|uniref:FlgD/Vpr Ig-like domain-containing protein n=1 Tax=candidate division TA06 bacterium B3_TA06 TaxID=2012487 RepID=A0A532V2K4_UNCT6|nr:MAG: hypothetical protein CEE36_08150 [candidate division TA06 bacterium B3_TA06]
MRGLIFILSALVSASNYHPSTLLVPPYRHTLGYNRANRFYLSLYLGGSFHFQDPQGLAGIKLRMYDDTITKRDDDELTLFAVHSGAGEIIYNVEFKRLERYGEKGSGVGQFNQPMGIAATRDGDVYVADVGNNRVVHLRYAEDGSIAWLQTIGSGYNHPTDVAVDSKGAIYVADEGNNRVVVFNPDGSVRSVWKRDLFKPRALAVIDRDAPANDNKDNFVVVIDSRQKRISMFDPYGDLKVRVTHKEMGYEDVRFAYVAIDRSGSIYVTDMHNHQIHKFDRHLHYIISIGREGSDDYEFYSPRGIVINPPTGQVFIAEAEGGQYYWIGADGFIAGCYPNPFDADQGTTISIYLTETATISVEIYDEDGFLVRKLSPRHKYPIGEALIVWDGRDERGERVKAGRYTVKAELKPANISKRYFKKELQTTVRCTE